MHFPALTSSGLAVLLLASNVVGVFIDKENFACCGSVGAYGPPTAPANWCEKHDPTNPWHMYCCSPVDDNGGCYGLIFPRRNHVVYYEKGRTSLNAGRPRDCDAAMGAKGWRACAYGA
ncbi:hypothetical protein PTMSG1_00638 [Pyrenophora teres f. maculata]|nr:hypothetical protein PTMSG1_00638 [Pyrenophora teres f. maculata]